MLLGATALASGAAAQIVTATATADATATEDAEIIVSGSRPIKESQEAALKAQKASPSLVSVVSADSVGRLPD
jgi:hypothetical protein